MIKLCEERVVSFAYIAQPNLKAHHLIELDEQMIVTIMNSIKFYHLHKRACSLKIIDVGHCCNFSNLTFQFRRRKNFHAEWMNGFLPTLCPSILFQVSTLNHIAKHWQQFFSLATLDRIVNGKRGKVVIFFEEPDTDKVYRRIARKCVLRKALLSEPPVPANMTVPKITTASFDFAMGFIETSASKTVV